MMSMSVTMHPIWQSGAVILAAGVAGALLLQILAHRLLPAMVRHDHTVLGAAIFSVIGTTYAVLLAFMATTAWEQYSTAEALARREADLIGSIYHVSYGVAEPAGMAIRDDLVAYVTHVINVEWPAQIAGHAVPAAEPLLLRPRSHRVRADANQQRAVERAEFSHPCAERRRNGTARPPTWQRMAPFRIWFGWCCCPVVL